MTILKFTNALLTTEMTPCFDFFIARYGRLTFSCYVNSLPQMVPKCSLALKIGFVGM